jgi:hypothetical protein
MANWVTCPHCQLKHSARANDVCPRCRQSTAGAAGSADAASPPAPGNEHPTPGATPAVTVAPSLQAAASSAAPALRATTTSAPGGLAEILRRPIVRALIAFVFVVGAAILGGTVYVIRSLPPRVMGMRLEKAVHPQVIQGREPDYTLTLPEGVWHKVDPTALPDKLRHQRWFGRTGTPGLLLVETSVLQAGAVVPMAEIDRQIVDGMRANSSSLEDLGRRQVKTPDGWMTAIHLRFVPRGESKPVQLLHAYAQRGRSFLQVAATAPDPRFSELEPEFLKILSTLDTPMAAPANQVGGTSGSSTSGRNGNQVGGTSSSDRRPVLVGGRVSTTGKSLGELFDLRAALVTELSLAANADPGARTVQAVKADLDRVESAIRAAQR